MSALALEVERLDGMLPIRIVGRVAELRGLTVLAEELPLPVGALVAVGPKRLPGEVVGFSRDRSSVMMLGSLSGVRPGDTVEGVSASADGPVGEGLLGRVVNALGEPIDHGPGAWVSARRPLSPAPLGAMSRGRITKPLRTGVRAIDLMTPLGRGQRMGVFAGPGVGKSTLLGQISRGTDADAVVIGLIGERGREVRDFVEETLGAEGLKRATVVVATGDESPLMRLRAAKLACAQAEHLRDEGLDVLLVMDSVTRFAHAQRQVGLSVGEPPATKGYTPSVFSELALLLERAGTVDGGGSVTGLYTILVEGDDMTEPVADTARGILDGHVILSRSLAQRGHYPAIDVLDSVSRVAGELMDQRQAAATGMARRLLAKFAEVEELVRIGAYARGADPETDAAIEFKDAIDAVLTQTTAERAGFEDASELLLRVALQAGERVSELTGDTGRGG
ncbi:MAG: FliI/YscN family ATPase [Planctomycetota bacterium]